MHRRWLAAPKAALFQLISSAQIVDVEDMKFFSNRNEHINSIIFFAFSLAIFSLFIIKNVL